MHLNAIVNDVYNRILLILKGGKEVIETELVKKIKNGDIEAFSELVTKYEKKAVNFAFRILKDGHEAEDAAQEAFLKAFDKINSFRQTSSFSTWFFTILNNVCLDILRRKKRLPDTLSMNQSNKDDEEYELQIEDNSPGPYESFQKKTALELLEEALDKISDEHRTIIIMRDINDMEYEEIAKSLNISLGTVKSRISRARMSLRKILEKNKELFL